MGCNASREADGGQPTAGGSDGSRKGHRTLPARPGLVFTSNGQHALATTAQDTWPCRATTVEDRAKAKQERAKRRRRGDAAASSPAESGNTAAEASNQHDGTSTIGDRSRVNSGAPSTQPSAELAIVVPGFPTPASEVEPSPEAAFTPLSPAEDAAARARPLRMQLATAQGRPVPTAFKLPPRAPMRR